MVTKTTSNPCWIDLLEQAIARSNKPSPRIAIVGVGQELRGDDAAGVSVARGLQALSGATLLIIDSGPAPENFTGRLRAFTPDVLILVDAVHMDAPPGTIHLLAIDAALPCSMTTHTLSIHLLADYLRTSLICDMLLLGIQPGQDSFGAGLSGAVGQSVEQIIRVLPRLLTRSLPGDD